MNASGAATNKSLSLVDGGLNTTGRVSPLPVALDQAECRISSLKFCSELMTNTASTEKFLS